MGKIFEVFGEKENMLRRSYYLDIGFCAKLEYLSENIYHASLNKLVCRCIENLIETEHVEIHKLDTRESTSKVNLYMKESLVAGLESLSKRCGLGLGDLVNIAVYNVLLEEEEALQEFKLR